MNDWDDRLGWAYGLTGDSAAERATALDLLAETRQRWWDAHRSCNQIWAKRDHPDFRVRRDALIRAGDRTLPQALWTRRRPPLSQWGGTPYSLLYLQWEALYPAEWRMWNRSWGTKLVTLRVFAQRADEIPAAILPKLEDLIMLAAAREYRLEDVGYARLARAVDSPTLRARLEAAALSGEEPLHTHAEYLLWLLRDPSLPHPKIRQWQNWLLQRQLATPGRPA